MITQVRGTAEGLELLSAVRDLLNQCWDQRDTIQPVTSIRCALRLLDVWTLLPQTNRKRCGEATCIAFAFGLLQQKRGLEECPVVAQDEALNVRPRRAWSRSTWFLRETEFFHWAPYSD